MTNAKAYYNENDPQLAAWLRELIAAGYIAPGDVDERSITDVQFGDVAGYTQCHFFAGIGGWSYALRLAGWPDNRSVWTGSCPCQPFSQVNRNQSGFWDERHLWPAWKHIIEFGRPATLFGEQVTTPIGLEWLSVLCHDLEAAGYAVACADLSASGAGAPHVRQRIYWMADANGSRLQGYGGQLELADARGWTHARGYDSATNFWADCEFIECSDGYRRPIQPGINPLAYGIPARVLRLRGYGNAIVPQIAAAFIRAAGGDE